MKILGYMLTTMRNRTGASAAGAQDYNHHAIHQWCVRNYCYFYKPIRAEDAVKLSPKVSNKDGKENQTKTIWVWCGRHNEKGMGCGKLIWWKKVLRWGVMDVRWKTSKAAARCNGHKAGRVDVNARRGLRSSSSLRVVAIQAIDIFIRGCYL